MSTIDDTMAQYKRARAGYIALLKTVYAETDPAKRNASIAQVSVQNEKLVGIAQTLLSQWDALNRTPATNQSLSELKDDLVRYRQDIETMKGLKDETTRLNMMYANITGDVSANRTTYYAYIIIVFVLLILMFVLFALRSVLGGVASTVETAVSTVLEPSSPSAGV
uniref:Uncharacterized protein n=1 Tax=viral metagenome TaxID=1070528 RepID=A0A6C0HLS1_9ZZZZ